MIPMYDTKTFAEVFPNAQSFSDSYNFYESAFFGESMGIIKFSNNTNYIYGLLYAKYANNPIGSTDENQFKAQIWSTINQYGPVWERKLEIQQKLKLMTDEQMRTGSKTINNQALNPDQEPTVEETGYINSQNVNKSTKSILGGYAELVDLLDSDVTKQFIDKFKPLFKKVVLPQLTRIYLTEVEE